MMTHLASKSSRTPFLLVTEIFHSLQGETSLSGVRFAFIRLTGCNLRCVYCDSTYAFKGGKKMSIPEILETIRPYGVKHVLLTGGEPLMQRQTPALAQALIASGYTVSIETHGEVSIEPVAKNCRIVMDVKTPSSKMCRNQWPKNLPLLKASDEIKFVIGSKEDYAWAKDVLKTHALPTQEVLFSPVVSGPTTEGIDARWLADQILEDQLPVRLQIQLHKHLWGTSTRGV